MAKIKPEELLAETDHLFPEVGGSNPECTFLREEYENLFERYEEMPAGPAKNRLLVQLRALAQRISSLHCPPYYPQ